MSKTLKQFRPSIRYFAIVASLGELLELSLPHSAYLSRCGLKSLCFPLSLGLPALGGIEYQLLLAIKLLALVLLGCERHVRLALVALALSLFALIVFDHVDAKTYMLLEGLIALNLFVSTFGKFKFARAMRLILLASLYFFSGLGKINGFYFKWTSPLLASFVFSPPWLLWLGIAFELTLSIGLFVKNKTALKAVLGAGILFHLILNAFYPITIYSAIMLFLYRTIYWPRQTKPCKRDVVIGLAYAALVAVTLVEDFNFARGAWILASAVLGVIAAQAARELAKVEPAHQIFSSGRTKLVAAAFVIYGFIPYLSVDIGSVYSNFFWMLYANRVATGAFYQLTTTNEQTQWKEFIEPYREASAILLAGRPGPQDSLSIPGGEWRAQAVISYLCRAKDKTVEFELLKLKYREAWWNFGPSHPPEVIERRRLTCAQP